MSTFTTQTKHHPAGDDCHAFTSASLQHSLGTVTVSGIESDEGKAHVAAYVHGTTAVEVVGYQLDDGTTSIGLRLAGDVPTTITIHGITLDALLAAVQAAKVQS